MKKRICILGFLILLLISSVSCGNMGYKSYYSTEIDGITYRILGKSKTRLQISVEQGDQVLWSEKLSRSKKLGNSSDTFGLQVVDLNFDGALDLMIPTDQNGESVFFTCWLKDPAGDGYTRSSELSALANIKIDEDLLAIFGFSQALEREELANGASHTVSTDTTTKYVWRQGKLQPQIRASLSYYSQIDRYCYSVSYYDEATGEFNDPDDRWLTPEEYRDVNFDFLYYFR